MSKELLKGKRIIPLKPKEALFYIRTHSFNENKEEYKIVEQALEDLELYKKSFELLCGTYEDTAFEKGYWLDQARKELNK